MRLFQTLKPRRSGKHRNGTHHRQEIGRAAELPHYGSLSRKPHGVGIPFFAHDGIDALQMLRGTNGRARLPRPYLILLDLNKPCLGGMEFLKELRQDEDLAKSIVFIMTSFGADQVTANAYNLGVAGYILKTNPANAFRSNGAVGYLLAGGRIPRGISRRPEILICRATATGGMHASPFCRPHRPGTSNSAQQPPLNHSSP